MHLLLPALMFFSGLGLLCSVSLHLATLTGHLEQLQNLLTEGMQYRVKGGITAGIFLMWVPAAMIAQRINQGNRLKFSWKKVLAGCPPWMIYTAYGLFAYAFANFFLSLSVGRVNGQQGLRAISGHWMIFYGLAFCIFFSTWRRPSLLRTQRCPAGHELMQDAAFCPQCGLPATQSGQDET